MMKKKASTSRKKTAKHINNEEARQVCFSKRRQDLFRKANELSILFGAMVGVVVFSASGRSYSFGHPTIEVVMNRFLAPNLPNVPATPFDGANQDGGGMTENMCLLLKEYRELQGLVKEEAKRKESLEKAIDKEMGSRMMQWLNADICDIEADELQEFCKELQEIQGIILDKTKQVQAEGALSSQQYQIGEPSTQPKPSAMDVASGSQQCLFGEPRTQPQYPSMDIASSLQYQFGEESGNGVIDGIAVNDPLLSGIYREGGSENFPKHQNVG